MHPGATFPAMQIITKTKKRIKKCKKKLLPREINYVTQLSATKSNFVT